MKKQWKTLFVSFVGISIVLSGCGKEDLSVEKKITAKSTETKGAEVIAPHKGINQEPVPLKIERASENEVNVEMTAQITDIEIDKEYMYKAWTFNGEAPGPVVIVNEE